MEYAAVYLRLSKEDLEKTQEEHSRSIENQRCILQEYARSHGFTIYEYYADDDYSGLSLERPAFTHMLDDASRHCFTTILAKSQSRLSRNMEHAEYLMHDLFPSLGIRFIGVVDGVDTAQKSGKKARQINALVNEWYSEDLSESIRAVYRRKMMNGEYLGAYAPYGYRKNSEDPHKLVIDEQTAFWVKKIYEWYIEGSTVLQIKKRLEENHVPTPTGKEIWSESTIKKILANEVYTGAILQGKSRRKSFKDKKLHYLPRKQWIVVEGMQEPIIHKELFEKAAARRRERRR